MPPASPGLSFPGSTLRTETQPLSRDGAFQICQAARQLPDVVSDSNDRIAQPQHRRSPRVTRHPAEATAHAPNSGPREVGGRFFRAPALCGARLPGGAGAMALLVGVD